MGKMLLTGLVAFILLFAVSIAIADSSDANDGSLSDRSGKAEIKDRTISPSAAANTQLINREAFAKLRAEEKEKLQGLNSERIEKLAELKAEQVKALAELKNEQLKTLTSENSEILKKFAELKKEELEKIAKLDRSMLKEFAKLNKSEIKARLNKTRFMEANESFRFRPLTLEQTRRSERAYEQLKENEEKLRENYEERLQKANETMERLRECKKNPDDEVCANVTERAINASREAALKAVERITNYLEKAKERINSSQDLTEEEVANRTARIDAIIAKIESIRTEIAAATTKEELNAAVKRLKDALKAIKSEGEDSAHRIMLASTNGIMKRIEVIEKKADCSLSSLEGNGTNTSSIDAKLDEYASLIAKAREKISEAKDAFNPDDKAAIEKSRALTKEARDAVQEAQEKLNEIRKDIRDLGGKICTQKQEIEIEDDEEN